MAATSCDCAGCEIMGQGACGSSICSECGEDAGTPLEMLDVKDAEFGLTSYRPCAECAPSVPAMVAGCPMVMPCSAASPTCMTCLAVAS